MKYDMLIKNAKIIDGSAAPWFMGDVAVADGRIAAVGKLSPAAEADAARVIDASGKILASSTPILIWI